jgi:hypothetical protein
MTKAMVSLCGVCLCGLGLLALPADALAGGHGGHGGGHGGPVHTGSNHGYGHPGQAHAWGRHGRAQRSVSARLARQNERWSQAQLRRQNQQFFLRQQAQELERLRRNEREANRRDP